MLGKPLTPLCTIHGNPTLIHRQYKCGCIAPKPANNPTDRCSSWEYRRSCEPKQLFSYLDVDCSVSCCWTLGKDKAPRQQEDWYLQNGPYEGEPSEEDYFLHRVPGKLNVPISVRRYRKSQATAARQRAVDNSEDRGSGSSWCRQGSRTERWRRSSVGP